jgi:hypothetical protein
MKIEVLTYMGQTVAEFMADKAKADEDVKKVREANSYIYRLNSETFKTNKASIRSNKLERSLAAKEGRKPVIKPYIEMKKLEVNRTKETSAFCEFVKKINTALNNRTQEEWLSEIMKLPKEARAEIAKTVWWDYFSSRCINDRWGALDDFLDCLDMGLTSYERVKYLLMVGYPPNKAIARGVILK